MIKKRRCNYRRKKTPFNKGGGIEKTLDGKNVFLKGGDDKRI